jgi:hypothetical protein
MKGSDRKIKEITGNSTKWKKGNMRFGVDNPAK